MDRSNDVKLPDHIDWLQDAKVQKLCAALGVEGGKVYFVGGCVRDALLGLPGSDVDLSTDILPQDVTRLAKKAGLKVIPTGIDHGTVTVVVGGTGFEVTTFRRDVATDGRRAVVAFSADMKEDACRRDFTLNALYATSDGVLIDPLSGLQDCLDRRIRFIEDAGMRIQEDYLRILRFFRFHAWYADPNAGFDPAVLNAIARNMDGLKTLSAERIGMEMLKLLSAPSPCSAIAAMRQVGCLRIVLPGSDDLLLGPLVHLETTVDGTYDALLRLAALGGERIAERLRLSKVDARRLEWLKDAGYSGVPLPELAYRYGYANARGAALLRAALAQQAISTSSLTSLEAAASQKFPLSAKDLMPIYQGKALGVKLATLEQRWIDSDFRLTRKDLLAQD
ncbi:MAG: CCA tRNA nucleotidyltransferase [Roseobacter sp.]